MIFLFAHALGVKGHREGRSAGEQGREIFKTRMQNTCLNIGQFWIWCRTVAALKGLRKRNSVPTTASDWRNGGTCKNFAHTHTHAVVPLGAHCPMHAWADVVLSFPCRHAGISYNGFVGYRGDDGRPGNCSNFEKLNLLACMANAIIHRTLAYVATFGSSRGIFRRTCTSTHIVTTMPFADRGSMVRLLVDSHLPKVGS